MQTAQVFNDLDVSQAQATIAADRDRILKDIQDTRGMQQMTHDLKDALVKVRGGIGSYSRSYRRADAIAACSCHVESARDDM
jgi:hypothetical protein